MRLNRNNASTHILAEALRCAQSVGYANVTLGHVAEGLGYTKTWVNRYFTADELRSGIVKRAIETRDLRVLAQAIASSDPLVAELPDELRRAAVEALL